MCLDKRGKVEILKKDLVVYKFTYTDFSGNEIPEYQKRNGRSFSYARKHIAEQKYIGRNIGKGKGYESGFHCYDKSTYRNYCTEFIIPKGTKIRHGIEWWCGERNVIVTPVLINPRVKSNTQLDWKTGKITTIRSGVKQYNTGGQAE